MAAVMVAQQRGKMMPACVFFLVLLLGSAASSTAEKAPSCNKFDPVIYVHENRRPPGETTVTSSSPSGNASIAIGNLEFGTIDVLQDVIREGVASDSKALGLVKGLLAYEKDETFYLSLVFVFSTPGCTGSLATLGVVDENVSGELAVTGGTGIFRRARGYIGVVTAVGGEGFSVFKLEIHADYP